MQRPEHQQVREEGQRKVYHEDKETFLKVSSFPNKHLISRVDKGRLLGDLISKTNQRVPVSDFVSLYVVHTQIVLSKERICCLVEKVFSAVIFVVVVQSLSCV